jgi:putative component of toxin-antitoxin plasmid stabilization module
MPLLIGRPQSQRAQRRSSARQPQASKVASDRRPNAPAASGPAGSPHLQQPAPLSQSIPRLRRCRFLWRVQYHQQVVDCVAMRSGVASVRDHLGEGYRVLNTWQQGVGLPHQLGRRVDLVQIARSGHHATRARAWRHRPQVRRQAETANPVKAPQAPERSASCHCEQGLACVRTGVGFASSIISIDPAANPRPQSSPA